MGKLLIHELAKFMVLTALVTMPYHDMGRAQNPAPGSSTKWATTTAIHGGERKTEMQFYIHELSKGQAPTVVEVVPAPGSNQTFSGFGYIAMLDDIIRVGSDPNSTLVGRAQGLDGGASRPDGLSLITALTYTFSDGIYNGSSLSVLGVNTILNPVREMPVVGGTGFFRMARGYVEVRTKAFDPEAGVVIVGLNVTVVH